MKFELVHILGVNVTLKQGSMTIAAPQMDFREDAPVADQMSAGDTEMIGCNHPPMVVLDKDGHRVDFSDQPQQKLSTEVEDM